MYRAKANGRNNFQFYAKEMNAELGERLSLENDLWQALERNELLLHYQPQINILTGEVIGMEALVRWQHPTLGLVPPIAFIPIAEDDGLIIPIGEWVLRKACEDNQQLQLDGFKPIRVAVNLSARQLVQKNLVRTVNRILEQTGLQPEYLELEITESMIMHNVEDSISLLNKINKLGVQLSLDDFGTGYSSLAYLKRFPIKRLKIDKSFIRDIATDPNDAIISRSIIALAHALQVESIAEGVETFEQFEFLKTNNCNEVQGYLFSKPLPIGALRDFLASNQVRMAIPSAALGF
jgi:EAL domain-containing protein (putative c-di-GMP-specific phosphodiesterase class I)